VWHKDYFIHCNSCDNTEWMDGNTIAEATKTARSFGWLVNGEIATCPNCRPTKDAADFRRARGAFHIEGLNAVEAVRKLRGG